MGVAPRVLSGWVPSPDDPSPWNQFQRELMFALVEVEADICGGCGGFLSYTTRQDHGLEVSRTECQHCVALKRANDDWDANDDRLKGTPKGWEPSARKPSVRPIPLTDEKRFALEMQGHNFGPRVEDQPDEQDSEEE